MENKANINFLLENQSSWVGKTPCFVVNRMRLDSCIKELKQNLKGEIAYSHKTNPDPVIIKEVFKKNCSFLVSSIEELRNLIKLTSVSTDKIIFQSPSLTKKQYNEARKSGVHRFSIDSNDQLSMILEDVERKINNSEKMELLVRINTGVKVMHPELPYGTDSYLGFPLAEAEKVLEKLNSFKKKNLIKKIGIHNHLLSQNTHLDMWKNNLDAIADFLIKLKAKNIRIDVVDFGGGCPVEYKKPVPSLSEIAKLFDNFKKRIILTFPNLHYVFEPGRKLVAESVSLVATVVHIKSFLKQNVAILDCSLYNCSLDTLIVGLHLPTEKIEEGDSSVPVNYMLRGSTPDSLDVFERNIFLPELKNGDYIAFLRCGAYSFGCDFISLPKAACVSC